MRRAFAVLSALSLALAAAPALRAQEASEAEIQKSIEQFEESLEWKQGKVTLPGGLATLTIPDGYYYLGPQDAQRVLVELWGNPPGATTLGMIFPDIPLAAQESWGVVVTFDESGYVSDKDAASIDYDELLAQMQAAAREENEARTKAGYDAVEIVGWATRPRYDQASHKLYWAENLKFSSEPANTLNYKIRALGRRGVLELNAVGTMDQLPTIERDMQAVLGFVDFNEGHRYTDFVEGDKVAAYGIAGLVAAKVAAKAGFFKLILGALVALKKGLVVIVIAAAALLKKLLGGRSEKPAAAG
jgi:uncharacterized membrane-anchored protein